MEKLPHRQKKTKNTKPPMVGGPRFDKRRQEKKVYLESNINRFNFGKKRNKRPFELLYPLDPQGGVLLIF